MRTVAEGAKALIVMEDQEVQKQQEVEEEKRQEETYEERHRRRTRRSLQRYPSSPELGEISTGKGKGKANRF